MNDKNLAPKRLEPNLLVDARLLGVNMNNKHSVGSRYAYYCHLLALVMFPIRCPFLVSFKQPRLFRLNRLMTHSIHWTVAFNDIGKASKDLLSKDFPVGSAKLEVKTTAPNGVVSWRKAQFFLPGFFR